MSLENLCKCPVEILEIRPLSEKEVKELHSKDYIEYKSKICKKCGKLIYYTD